jgi:glycosyltransferase involved in cell wall biosynthesis
LVWLPPIPWEYRHQRPQRLALALARRGWRVVWVEAFRREWLQPRLDQDWVADGIRRILLRVPGRPSPYEQILPSELGTQVAAWLARQSIEPRAVLVEHPTWLDAATALRSAFAVPVIYDRLDLYGRFPGAPPWVADADSRLLSLADAVVSSSAALRPSPSSRPALLLRNAHDGRPAAARRALGRPRVGYLGALAAWFDLPTVLAVVARHAAVDFEFIGHVEERSVRRLRRLPNAALLGELPHAEAMARVAAWSAAWIPFLDSELTRAVDPVKLYEYLAAGLPVLVPGLPELGRFGAPAVYAYGNPEEAVSALARALAEDGEQQAASRRRLVARETWDERARELAAFLEPLERLEPLEQGR